MAAADVNVYSCCLHSLRSAAHPVVVSFFFSPFLQQGHLVKSYPSRSENPLHLGNSYNQMRYLLIPAGQENCWAAPGGQTSGSTAIRPGGIRCAAQGRFSRMGAGSLPTRLRNSLLVLQACPHQTKSD